MGELIPGEIRQLVINTALSGSINEIEQTYGENTLSLSLAPISDGNFVNIYGIDITRRKRAEKCSAPQ